MEVVVMAAAQVGGMEVADMVALTAEERAWEVRERERVAAA